MITYPNIFMLHENNEIIFHNKTHETMDQTDSCVNKSARKILKFKKILKNKDSLILILRCDYTHLTDLIKYIKSCNIKKIYFFIDDVFRISEPNSTERLQTYVLEKNLNSCKVEEIEIINYILKSANIESYEIYHCEYNNSLVEKKYNLKLKYFDVYLSNYELKKQCCALEYHDKIVNKISCFNHRAEPHRHLISSLLYDNSDCIITYVNKFPLWKISENTELPISNFTIKKTLEESLIRFNKTDLFFIKDNQFVSVSKNKNDVYLDWHTQNDDLILSTIQESFVNLVTETRFSSLSTYISEKSLKPMYVYRPFIMLSSYGTLLLLKKLGFQTFDKWWDESYDLEPNHVKRFEMVYEIAKEILSYDKEQLVSMLADMRPILQHNRDNLKNITKNMVSLN